MDLRDAIRELYNEKQKLERIISLLEEFQQDDGRGAVFRKTPGRRGRTSMGAKERREVSERMKKYWAGRRMLRNI